MERKGIILAGGAGTRLHPATLAISKQLMPVYDKPMIYYPLTTLIAANIRDMLIITTPGDAAQFRALLGDGSRWGLSLRYAVQPAPSGIAQALVIAADFADEGPVALILGDNLFHGSDLESRLRLADAQKRGATIFSFPVADPSRYGVVGFDEAGRPADLVEKPVAPRSAEAVTGLYFYDGRAASIARGLTPSARGELEITDLNRAYLAGGDLHVERLGPGFAWLDTGTTASMMDAAQFVRIVEERQGIKIGCPEEAAWRRGWIDDAALEQLAQPLRPSGYGEYLLRILGNGRR